MKRLIAAASVALLGLIGGCTRPPTAPASVTSPELPAAPVSMPALQTLRGYVGDTAFRPLPGVSLEVVSGPDTGKALTSDANGAFSYTGMFSDVVSIRATKEGYVARTSSVFSNTSTDLAFVSFLLAPLTPPTNAAGDYTLTIAVDSACAGFPDEVRTRSYAARLTKRTGGTAPADTQFDGTVTGAQFAPFANVFWVGVAGDFVAVSTEGEGPSIVEQVGPTSYIAYSGGAGASVPSGGSTMISAPFNGVIEYCELKSAIGQYYDCSFALAAAKVQCTTDNRLTLTPR